MTHELKKEMQRRLTCLRLEVDHTIVNSVEDGVYGYLNYIEAEVEALRASEQRLRESTDKYQDLFVVAFAENKRLREALEWYADKSNWDSQGRCIQENEPVNGIMLDTLWFDHGTKARQALQPAEATAPEVG